MKNVKKLKVGILSPYFSTLGGGERYIFSIADSLNKYCEVYIYGDENYREKSLSRFGISLKDIHFIPLNLFTNQNILNRYIELRKYGLFIYMTDGSIFFPAATKNLLIIQSPLHIPKSGFLNNFKLKRWKIICYSQFMKTIIENRLGPNTVVKALPPCIDVPDIKNKVVSKENIILTVGRFFPYPHDKKHEVLINIFRNNYKKYFNEWKLIIAGGLTENGGRQILNKLQNQAKGLPIEIYSNLSVDNLNKLYQRAKIYWHATGFGEDLVNFPEKAEHFGIAPLEAMINGTVPLVFNGGGLKDIISEGYGGYLWETEVELINKTHRLISDEKLLHRLSDEARLRAGNYSCGKFYEKMEKIIA